jgi:hypothetical protein
MQDLWMVLISSVSLGLFHITAVAVGGFYPSMGAVLVERSGGEGVNVQLCFTVKVSMSQAVSARQAYAKPGHLRRC